MNRSLLLLSLSALLWLFGCKSFVNKIAVSSMVGMMQESRATFEQEDNLELAEIALAANLKLLEAMWYHDKDNEELNLFLAEGFAQYSLGFLEDKREEFEEIKPELSEYYRLQAFQMYQRSMKYSARVLLPRLKVANLQKLNSLHHEEFKGRLEKLEPDDIKVAFWYAFALGSSINLNREDVAGFANLYQVEMLLEKVKSFDDTYYFAAAYMFTGLYHGSRTRTLGGNPELAKKNFDKALLITEKKFLMIPYLYAKSYCISQQDIACFEKNLNYVLKAPDDLYPEQKMANLLAKKKARRLLGQKEELFLENVVSELGK